MEDLNVSVADNMNFIIPLINKEFNLSLPKDYDLLSEFTKRFERNEGIWPVIKKAKEKYKIGLLTDQYPEMLEDIYKKSLMPDVEFDVIVDSSKEKIKKPCFEIYKLAEEKSGFSGSEILFIDNSKKNLLEPQKLGWQTLFYDLLKIDDSNSEIIRLL